MREFQGQQQHQIEVQLESMNNNTPNEQSPVLKVTLTNSAMQQQTLQISDTFYGAPEQHLTLAAQSSQTLYVNVENSFGWYDLQVRLPGDKVYLRRFAGHIETGRASRSGPANGKFILPIANKT